MKRALLAALVFSLSSLASAQQPDVTIYSIGDSFGSSDVSYRGTANNIAAYAFATQSCNSGTGILEWYAAPDTRHPVIAQNMFRLKDGRFEQIGQSWLKHAFCAVNETEPDCGPCSSTPCSTLGVGCADTYTSGLNDGAGGGSKRFVNAALGTHTEGSPNPVGLNAIRGRLQVHVPDIEPAMNPGGEYFIESQYITGDDSAFTGVYTNNASWRRINVNAVNSLTATGPTFRGEAAIFAWQNSDPAVQILQLANREEGGARTTFYVGYKATDLGGGQWAYEYAIQNLNSHQSARSFRLDVPGSTNVTDIGFHDVDYHSGDPYDGTDWSTTLGAGSLTWETDTFADNENANALRWGTMYNYRFVADAAPVSGTATLGLFRPDAFTEIDIPSIDVPGSAGNDCINPASVASRNGGANLNTYTATTPSAGANVTFSVNGDYMFGVVFAYNTPASIPLANGQVLLSDTSAGLMFTTGLTGLPNGTSMETVPTNLSLCGATAYSQGLLVTPTAGGPPIQLTNSQDLTIGF